MNFTNTELPTTSSTELDGNKRLYFVDTSDCQRVTHNQSDCIEALAAHVLWLFPIVIYENEYTIVLM